MVAEAPALIIFSKTFLIATENSTSALTHIMFLLVQTPPIFFPGKFPTWIVPCQRWLGGSSSVSLGPTPSTLCLWIAIVNAMEQASARPTLHLEQLRVLAGLIFFWTVSAFGPQLVGAAAVFSIAPLLKCILDQDFHVAFTIIIPDLRHGRFCWALVQSLSVDQVLLGRKNEDGVLLFPFQLGQHWSSSTLQWYLWAIPCVC